MNAEQALAECLADQAWAFVRNEYPTVSRIADNGVDATEYDMWFAQKLAQLVRAEIQLRAVSDD